MGIRTWEEYANSNIAKTLNLGCGRTTPQEWWNVDCIDFPGVDQVCDLENGIEAFDNTFDVVIAHDFLEHIHAGSPSIKIMEEIYRVLKPKGVVEIDVPSVEGNNIGAFQDPTHVSFWNRMKFNYFLDDKYGNNFRSLYNIKCWFYPIKIELYDNQWNVSYIKAVLSKGELND